MIRHFVDLFDLTAADDARDLLDRAASLKREHASRASARATWPGRTLGLIFEKPSLRTRVSFEAAIAQLGGNAIFLRDKDVGMGSPRERRRLRPGDQPVRRCPGRPHVRARDGRGAGPARDDPDHQRPVRRWPTRARRWPTC